MANDDDKRPSKNPAADDAKKDAPPPTEKPKKDAEAPKPGFETKIG